MTFSRCAATTAVMAAVGWGLWLLSPGTDGLVAVLTDPQHVVDTAGADAVLVPLAWALAAACWTWGAVGLGLTVLSAVPGAAGGVAGVLLGVVLPAGLRQVAAVAVGVSLATVPVVASAAPVDRGAPVATSAQKVGPPAPGADEVGRAGAGWSDVGGRTAVADASTPVVPDWPTAPVADAPAGEHVVLRGDCLWDIAEAWLADRSTGPITPAATAAAVQAWWQANADVVGSDPDLLLPGQVLRAPTSP